MNGRVLTLPHLYRSVFAPSVSSKKKALLYPDLTHPLTRVYTKVAFFGWWRIKDCCNTLEPKHTVRCDQLYCCPSLLPAIARGCSGTGLTVSAMFVRPHVRLVHFAPQTYVHGERSSSHAAAYVRRNTLPHCQCTHMRI